MNMGRDKRLLRNIYYERFVMKRYIRMGEAEKNIFSVMQQLQNGPLKRLERRNCPEMGLRRHTKKKNLVRSHTD